MWVPAAYEIPKLIVLTITTQGIRTLVYMHNKNAKVIRTEIDTNVTETLGLSDLNLPRSFQYYNFAYQ